MSESANIFAELKEIEYTPKISSQLEVFGPDQLLSGELSSNGSFILQTGSEEYAFSQWVSPKRTRTFPFARVYDTLCRENRVTLIPFCKDEGADGDRDFIQWDTVSLMSLLNVYVIVGYYSSAKKNLRPGQEHKNKISEQVFDYEYVMKQLKELQGYHSSALHWNLKQMEQLSDVAEMTLESYRRISEETGVLLHGEKGIRNRIGIATADASRFRDLSRQLAEKAQIRETLTEQPKEKTIGRKAVVTLQDLMGGIYYWTVDECFVLDGHVFLVEKKHSRGKLLPTINDIKDAFIKSALFSNIDTLKYNGEEMPCCTVVGLTSEIIQGFLHSNMSDRDMDNFFSMNGIKGKKKEQMLSSVDEAQSNTFGLFVISSADAIGRQESILQELRGGISG